MRLSGYTRRGTFIESWEEMKQKFKEKYLSDSYTHRLLDKLHNFRPGSRSVQEYITDFDDLTLRCEVQEDSYQAISRYRSGWRSDIQ